MITALQASKLRAANNLMAARTSLLASRAFYGNDFAEKIEDIVLRIDNILATVVTNTAPGEVAP